MTNPPHRPPLDPAVRKSERLTLWLTPGEMAGARLLYGDDLASMGARLLVDRLAIEAVMHEADTLWLAGGELECPEVLP